MTRINSAIPVKCLTDEHLLAEHREIKRMSAFLERKVKSHKTPNIPNSFTLGAGHMTFFVDKMLFLYRRYIELYNEVNTRGFNVTYFGDNFKSVRKYTAYWNDYKPSHDEYIILVERITNRLKASNKKHWHYYGERINADDAVSLLKLN